MGNKQFFLKNSTLSLTLLSTGAKIASLKYQNHELVFLPGKQIIELYAPQKDQVFDEKVAWGGVIFVPLPFLRVK